MTSAVSGSKDTVEDPEKAQNDGSEVNGEDVSGRVGNRMSTNTDSGEVKTSVAVSSYGGE